MFNKIINIVYGGANMKKLFRDLEMEMLEERKEEIRKELADLEAQKAKLQEGEKNRQEQLEDIYLKASTFIELNVYEAMKQNRKKEVVFSSDFEDEDILDFAMNIAGNYGLYSYYEWDELKGGGYYHFSILK